MNDLINPHTLLKYLRMQRHEELTEAENKRIWDKLSAEDRAFVMKVQPNFKP